MKPGKTYTIQEGPMSQPAYLIRTKAVYCGPSKFNRFHIFKTVETVPRLLTVPDQNIVGFQINGERHD